MHPGRISTILIGMIVIASTAWATPAKVVGEKNYTRGVRAELRGDVEEARNYYAIAFAAFEECMAEKKADNQGISPSMLMLAGISATKSGEYMTGANLLAEAIFYRPDISACYAFGGVAHARMGQADMTRKMWAEYPIAENLPILAKAVKEQVAAMDRGEVDLIAMADAVSEAWLKQVRDSKRKAEFSGNNSIYPLTDRNTGFQDTLFLNGFRAGWFYRD